MKRYAAVLLLGLVIVLALNSGERNVVGQAKKEPINVGLLADKTGGHAAYGYSH